MHACNHRDDKPLQSISEMGLVCRVVEKEDVLEGVLCTSLAESSWCCSHESCLMVGKHFTQLGCTRDCPMIPVDTSPTGEPDL